MSKADVTYIELINEVLTYGVWDEPLNVRTIYSDGTPATTKAIINKQLKFDNSELPILTQKRVPLKDPIKEMFWIWQRMSNSVQDLRDVGCGVWDEWELQDGTIGRAYGWQLRNKKRKVRIDETLVSMVENGQLSISKKMMEKYSSKKIAKMLGKKIRLNQVDYLLYQLMKNPYSRRIKTTLYCIEDLDDMALEPCVYETHWQLWNGTLNLTVNIRSNDLCLGNPYNIYQYAILHRLIAQVTGHSVGEICFNIDNAHIYSRHIEKVKEQIKRPMYAAPAVKINPLVTSFFDFTMKDIEIINYQHGESISYEVAL
ncbi:thymidylate synthase [Solibacillus sp. FSL H8-0523]|uniref:thymidylate synthase n=1 Tax=Solibacillus sp. FSL H8-0523 TaxID=2954511 RepID=UPI003101081A